MPSHDQVATFTFAVRQLAAWGGSWRVETGRGIPWAAVTAAQQVCVGAVAPPRDGLVQRL